jgi:formate hydrogenlyase subunit 3/multisubunit Na+/H+ antiporter MnhD subunit
MFVLIFALPFAAALLCLGLSRTVATRWLGFIAAGALLVAAGILLLEPLPLALPERSWAMLGERPVRLALLFDATSRPFALLALGGGALALLALALALPPDLRGFGGLFATLLLAPLAIIAGLANQEPLLLPFAWALVALLGFTALRASGTSSSPTMLPGALLAGMLGTLLLTAAALLPAAIPGEPLTPAVLVCWTLVGLLAFGAPVFHALFDDAAAAPAALAGMLLALGLPLLGGYAFIRFAAAQWDALPLVWRVGWALLGLLTLLACAAGATSTTRVRQLLGWQLSAQLGLVLIYIGVAGGAPPLAVASEMLINAVLTTLAGYLAVAILERRAGTDDLAEIGAHGPLILPGLAFLLAAASALGLPGTWGWWQQSELLGAARSSAPWMLPPLLAGGALRGLAYIAPLAAFWRANPPAAAGPTRRSWAPIGALLCPTIAVLPLVVWGVVPQLAERSWLAALRGTTIAGGPERLQPDMPMQVIAGLAALVLVALPLLALRGRGRSASAEQDIRNPALLTPQALGQSLRGLVWLGDARELFRTIWAGLLGLSRGAARLLALFEQRYYLAGLMLAVIIVIMLMI